MGIFNKLRSKVRETVEETKTSIRETVDSLRYDKLKEGLKKTRQGISEKIGFAALQGKVIDDEVLDRVEEDAWTRNHALARERPMYRVQAGKACTNNHDIYVFYIVARHKKSFD